MSNHNWRIKALADAGELKEGMAVTVQVKDPKAVPDEDQIKDAFNAEYDINAPDGIYGDKEKIDTIRKTSFFYDDSPGNPAELLIDYFMSWTIRCSTDTYRDEASDEVSDKVHKSAKFILHFLLKDYLGSKEFTVVDVETLKQWKKIDLLCSVQIRVDREDTWYVMAFENKMYTKLHDNQLERYVDSVNRNYKEDPKIKKVFIYLTTHAEVPPEDEELCRRNGYVAYSLSEISTALRKNNFGPTGNALFDEFWHYFYK